MSNFIKYEIKICYFSEYDINEDSAIIKMQDAGWEISGSIGVPQDKAWCNDKSITVPFRRKLS